MHQCRNVDDTTDFICDHPSHDVDWAQPEPPALPPSGKTPLATALYALALDIDNGAPAFCFLGIEPGVIEIQLPATEPGQARAELATWGRCLGVTTVKVDHDWAASGDRYAVEGILCEGWRLRAWNAWRRPDSPKPTSHVPLHTLEPRAFDDPPAAPVHDDDPSTHDFVESGPGQEPTTIEGLIVCPRCLQSKKAHRR